MDFTFFQTGLDNIPKALEYIRLLISQALTTANIPINYMNVLFLCLALFGAYYWTKQWLAVSVFSKLSTFLNYLLLALVFYLVMAYV